MVLDLEDVNRCFYNNSIIKIKNKKDAFTKNHVVNLLFYSNIEVKVEGLSTCPTLKTKSFIYFYIR